MPLHPCASFPSCLLPGGNSGVEAAGMRGAGWAKSLHLPVHLDQQERPRKAGRSEWLGAKPSERGQAEPPRPHTQAHVSTLQNSGVSRTPLFLSPHQQILTISPSKYIWGWQLFTQSQLAPRPGPVDTHLDSCSGHPAGLPAAALAHLFSAQHPSAALRTSGRSHPSQNQSRRFSHGPPSLS